jgi:hypothetical protein
MEQKSNNIVDIRYQQTGSSSATNELGMREMQAKAYEARDKRFLLINKGIVVNMDHIKAIVDGVCIMDNGDRLPLKVRQMNNLRQTWQNYCFDKLREGQGNGI